MDGRQQERPTGDAGAVVDTFGCALHLAQAGGKHEQAKPLKGHGSVGILDVVENWKGVIYHAVYTVRFSDAVYVPHCLQVPRRSNAAPRCR